MYANQTIVGYHNASKSFPLSSLHELEVCKKQYDNTPTFVESDVNEYAEKLHVTIMLNLGGWLVEIWEFLIFALNILWLAI